MRWKDAVSQGMMMMMIQEGLSPLLSAISSGIDMATVLRLLTSRAYTQPPHPPSKKRGVRYCSQDRDGSRWCIGRHASFLYCQATGLKRQWFIDGGQSTRQCDGDQRTAGMHMHGKA